MPASSHTTSMLALAAMLLILATSRWHDAAVAQPDRIASVDGPSAVLLVQAGDCPDRRAAMVAWLESVSGASLTDPLPVSLAVLDDEALWLEPQLARLSRMEAGDVSRIARAVLRAGIPGTPALILLDAEGRVLLTDTFATTGPGPRLALAAELLPQLHPLPRVGQTLHPDAR